MSKHKMPKSRKCGGTIGFQAVPLALCCVFLLSFLAASPCLAASYPSWWTNRSVITNVAATNDFVAVTSGQLKWFATKAYEELDENLPSYENAAIYSVISPFSSSNNNYYAVTVGQLKNVANPFWNRLIEVGYTNSPPWTTNTTADDNDFAAVNIGQLKNAFYFDISTNVWLQTQDTSFDPNRGFYTTNISVTVSSAPNAVIYCTLDGSDPSPTHYYAIGTGTVTLVISNTTCLRAMAQEPGKRPTNIDTQTYVFLADVIARTNAPDGYPTNWTYTIDGDTNVYTAPSDYGMGTNVTCNPAYAGLITNSLKCIPTLSIVMDPADMFGTGGIYCANSNDVEKPASIELIYPDGRKGCHETCAIEAHSRFWEYPGTNVAYVNLKRSFRLSFKSDYGASKLKYKFFESAPVNSESAVSTFDKIILRAGSNRSYAGGKPQLDQIWTTYTRDQWGRDSQIAVSGVGVHGTFVHLYINGIYWGLYNPCERPDESFTSDYLGGEKEDWYANKDGSDLSGNNSVWTNLIGMCANTNVDWTTATAYTNVQQYLNVTNFCDYVLVWWYCGCGDWDEGYVCKNFYAGNRNNPQGPLSYFCWDMEMSWATSGFSTNGAWVKPSFLQTNISSTNAYIAGVFRPLWKNAEFRTLFADRLYKHCFNDGALSDTNSQKRWMSLCNFIEDAMIAESARWGDAKAPYGTNSVPVITRDDYWFTARDNVYRMMDRNSKRFLIACRQAAIYSWPLYPILDAPEFNQNGGVVTNGFKVSITNDGGTTYYTLNGLDPRAVGGDTNAAVNIYTNEITINGTTVLKARSRSGDVWSALHEATFTVNPSDMIRITEIMYHPIPNGTNEFIELQNIGSNSVDLTGWHFTDGVTFSFTNGPVLSPGQYTVVVKDMTLFTNCYTNVAVGGVYSGSLNNSGEWVKLANSNDQEVVAVEYDDHAPWPEDADGNGYSLVIVNPAAEANTSSNWRASAWINGSPGSDDVFRRDLGNSRPAVSDDAIMLCFTGYSLPLRGLASDDGFGTWTNLNWAWSVLNGAGGVTFSSNNAPTTAMSASTAGVYTVNLAVDDGQMSNSCQTTIQFIDQPATTSMIFWVRSTEGISINASGGVTNWQDRTGAGHDASQTNESYAPTWHANVYKTAPGLYFDGTNDNLHIASSTDIDNGASYSNRVLTLAFRTTEDISRRQVLYEQGGTNSGLNMYIEDGLLYMGGWNLTTDDNWGGVWFSTPVAKGMEYVAELNLESPNIRGYINGVNIGETNGIGSIYPSSDGICIGGISGWTRFADGVGPDGLTNNFQGWISETMQAGSQVTVMPYLITWASPRSACPWEWGVVAANVDLINVAIAFLTGAYASMYPPDSEPQWNYDTDNYCWNTINISFGPWIKVNNDDDNSNSVPDWQDSGAIQGEDDLVQLTATVTLHNDTGGTFKVSWPSDVSTRVKVWTSTNRTSEASNPTTIPNIPAGTTTTNFWIEGTNASQVLGDVGFTATYGTHCITATGVVIDVIFSQINNPETVCDTNILSAVVNPFDVSVSSYRFESRQVSGSTWSTMTNSSSALISFTPIIPGHFKRRVVAVLNSTEFVSAETNVETRFPDNATIAGNAVVEAQRSADWTAASGTNGDHNERGGWIYLNTQTYSYRVDTWPVGTFLGCGPSADPADSGSEYFVGTYHLHATLRDTNDIAHAANFPTGASTEDGTSATEYNTPGLLRDRHADEIIETGHTDYYFGPTRRTTPQ